MDGFQDGSRYFLEDAGCTSIFRSWVGLSFIEKKVCVMYNLLTVNHSFVFFLTFMLVVRSLNPKQKWLPSWKLPHIPSKSLALLSRLIFPGAVGHQRALPLSLNPLDPSAFQEMIEGGQFSTRRRLTLQEDPLFFFPFFGRKKRDQMIRFGKG